MEAHESHNRLVRLGSALFFLVCVPLSIWETSVHSKIFVALDPVATAHNLLSNTFSFRAAMVSHFIGTIAFIIMVLMFYQVLRLIDNHLSWFMIIPIIAQFSIVFILETLNYTALMTLQSDPRASFDLTQQQETAYFLMRISRYGIGADKIIFGLYFIPFGVLIVKSGLAPRFIGILMMLGGIGYVADTCLYILLPRSNYLNIQTLKLYSSVCYSIGLLWFLIKGVRHSSALTPNISELSK